MNILVIGGNRLAGRHLVKNLIKDGYNVTIANRGILKEDFGKSVTRIKFDRNDIKSIIARLTDKKYDIVYDNLAFSSNNVKSLLNHIKCEKYIQISSASVYNDISLYSKPLSEDMFDPNQNKLIWCDREDFTYDIVKQQAETAIFQNYHHLNPISVRFPIIFGVGDHTERLLFYVKNIIQKIPINVTNVDSKIPFISSKDAGKFLSTFVNSDFYGAINACSYGFFSVNDIFEYIKNKTGLSPIISTDGIDAPLNGAIVFSLDLKKSTALGYKFSNVSDWIYPLMDYYIYNTTSSI